MSPTPRKPAGSGSGGGSRAGSRSAASSGKPASGSKAASARKPAAPRKPAAARKPAGSPKSAAAPASAEATEARAEWIGLHSLAPAPGSRRPRKRIGRGEGSGTGKTSGRGQKGYGSRSGAKSRARFEGGQMPIHMRMRKLRGPNKKQSMPFEPFRTHTQPINLAELEARFEAGAEVTLDALKAKGLGKRTGIPVKILARGEISKALTVHAHAFSATARERIEAAGGVCVVSGSE
jgi:large subunit ribosomal protein L15